MRARRAGFAVPTLVTVACLTVAAVVPARAQGDPAGRAPAGAGLPDSVLAAIGERRVTRAEFLRQWERVGESLGLGAGDAGERKREFLDHLLDKEALTQAAFDAGYEPDEFEEARLGFLRFQNMRRTFLERMVRDSLPAAASDAERSVLQERRYAELVQRYAGALELEPVRENLAYVVVLFDTLPEPVVHDAAGNVVLNLAAPFPEVPPADTGRVLVRSTLGEFTVGRLGWHWWQLPVEQRVKPETPEDVFDWVRRFLTLAPMDAEARARGWDRTPGIELAVERLRERMAAEWYYQEHVLADLDTSDARLRRRWEEDPEAFRVPPHYLHQRMWYPSREGAEVGLAALAAGAAWDSLVQARYAQPHERRAYAGVQLLHAEHADTALTRWFSEAAPGEAFGPRRIEGRWWIYRLVEYRDGTHESFAEARPIVFDRVFQEQTERLLRERLAELRERYGVTVNESALAALELPRGPAIFPETSTGGFSPGEPER